MLYIVIIVLLTVVDQVVKYVMMNVSGGQIGYSIPVIKNFFHLTYVENHGVIFGLFEGKISIFTVISIILILYVIFTEFKNFKNYTKWTKIGISIIAAGAAGNIRILNVENLEGGSGNDTIYGNESNNTLIGRD